MFGAYQLHQTRPSYHAARARRYACARRRRRREATSCSAYGRSLLKPGLKVRAVVGTIPDAAMLRALS